MPGNSILGVFAKSPIKPIEEHINTVHQASERLLPFFAAVYNNDWDLAEKLHKEISEIEKEADVLKRDIRLQLPSGIFMPVERTDLLELITQQDKIANKAKDISGRVYGRRLEIPAQIQVDFKLYVQRCIDAVEQSRKAINEFDELLETSFSGREIDIVEKMISELDAIEDDTDSMQIELRKSLQTFEKDLNPIDVMFIYDIINWVGGLADEAERVGARLELMLAR
ncbi:TIGR00153 family protein [Flocculibacter collagenilyticus]|uniref:TIGR00153 family protein n=1 Tax=Flocculibacter collagenilyticus TaxID=2744479 RepID=UPI0018F4F3D3|nr:TIGR00153 family protein [Flocculibacter collagenilyticus]